MKLCILSVLIFFRLLSNGQINGSYRDFKKDNLEKITNQKKYLASCLALVNDADLDFKPVPEELELRDLVLHIGQNMIWLSEDYLNGAKFKSDFRHKDLNMLELRDHMNKVFDFALASLALQESKNYDERVKFFAGEKSRGQIVELLDDHISHHKGQLTVYLRLLGHKPPKFVGW